MYLNQCSYGTDKRFLFFLLLKVVKIIIDFFFTTRFEVIKLYKWFGHLQQLRFVFQIFFSALYQPNITPEPQMDDYFTFKMFNQNMDYSLETVLQ